MLLPYTGFVGGIAALPGGRFAVASLVPHGMRTFVLQVFDRDGRLVRQAATSFAPVRPFPTATVLDAFVAGGALYVFGRFTPGPTGEYAYFLYRYHLDGRLDSSFGHAGRLLLGPRGHFFSVDQVAVDPARRVVAVGAELAGASWRLFVARYRSDGAPDAVFGSQGIRYFSLGATTSGFLGRTAIAIERDGQIVAAGATVGGRTRVFLLLRNGTLNGSFILP